MIRPRSFPFGKPIIAILKLCVWSQDEEKIRRIWDDYSASEDRHLYLHFISGEPVAVIGLERSHGRPTVIRHLAVASHHQRKGLGRLLMDQIPDTTLTAETDHDSVAFYRRCGFSVRSLGEQHPGVERFECIRSRPTQS
jgi:GNAT superfamily N-acetyltransferase